MSTAKDKMFEDMERDAEQFERDCAEGLHSFSNEGTCACGAVELPRSDPILRVVRDNRDQIKRELEGES